MNYSFDIDIAKKYGVENAVLIHNIGFWLKKNISNKTHIYDGYVWTFNSAEAFEELFPFWTGTKIARMLRELESNGILKSGNYNKVKFDRTKWYTISEQSIVQIYELHCANLNNGLLKSEQSDYANLNNGLLKSEQPIPDVNTDVTSNGKPDIIPPNPQGGEVEKPTTKKFIRPTIEQIAQYCAERNNVIDAEAFFYHYESNGWKVGNSSMKDWKASVVTWEKKRKDNPQGYNNFQKQLPPKQTNIEKQMATQIFPVGYELSDEIKALML